MAKEKVLIVGGGFGGVKAALALSDDSRFTVTLLNDHTDFRYYPTLYHTATGGRRASSSVQLSNIFEGKPVTLAQGSAVSLDRKAKTVTTKSGETYSYDTLILGLGVVTNYFGIPGLTEFSYGIKSDAEALRFKKHLHDQLLETKKPDINYMIVGAGPTGIELAGALPAYLHRIMKLHGIKDKQLHVHLVEAAPRLLPRMHKSVSRHVRRRLKRLRITLHLNTIVQGETADELTMSGKPVKSHTVIWTAGVTNHPFFAENHFVLMPRGKVATDVYLQADENIFVVGDNANTPYSGLAQTAVRDGAFVAYNLKRRKDGKTMHSYHPVAPISVIPAGKHWAAVSWGSWNIFGLFGWMLRSAADFVAFKDLESWSKAAHQWASDFGEEEDCTICRITTS